MASLLWLFLAVLHLGLSLIYCVAGLMGDAKTRESVIGTALHLAALAAVVALAAGGTP